MNVVRGIKKICVGQSQVSDNTRPIGEKVFQRPRTTPQFVLDLDNAALDVRD